VAIQAATQLKVTWKEPPQLSSSGNMWKQMRDFDSAGEVRARFQVNTGNVDSAFNSAPIKVADRTYKVAYNGHMAMAPAAAIADVKPNGAVIFSNTQNPYSTRGIAASILGLPQNNVRVFYFEGGSCYGPNQYNDAAYSAAIVSQQIGKPVKLQFMRWDEHGWDYHGPPLMADMRGGVDANGKIVAYEYTAFAQPGTSVNDMSRQLTGHQAVPTPGNGSANTAETGAQYALSNRRIIAKSLPLMNNYFKTSALRAPNAVQANFASEQFVDELAHAAGIDPVQFRRQNINPATTAGDRWSSVLEAVATLAKWQPKVAASNLGSGNLRTGRGVAIGGFAGSQVGVVADIEVNTRTGKISVKDIYAAENAGLTVFRGGTENQNVGCLVTGCSRALVEQIAFNRQRITSLDWVTYPVIRFQDAPRTHSITVQRPDLQPTGSGEPAIVPVGAAIANAFFDATGVRIREMPMTPARVRGVLRGGS
jgi:CO/xanthine dehydrogenase Mo-binding subunit